MLEFLKTYWREILEVVVLTVSIIIATVRKKPSSSLVSDIKARLAVLVPVLVKQVESPGNGSEKKSIVIGKCLSAVTGFYGRKLQEDESSYWKQYVSNQIEDVLSTPQKKGD